MAPLFFPPPRPEPIKQQKPLAWGCLGSKTTSQDPRSILIDLTLTQRRSMGKMEYGVWCSLQISLLLPQQEIKCLTVNVTGAFWSHWATPITGSSSLCSSTEHLTFTYCSNSFMQAALCLLGLSASDSTNCRLKIFFKNSPKPN